MDEVSSLNSSTLGAQGDSAVDGSSVLNVSNRSQCVQHDVSRGQPFHAIILHGLTKRPNRMFSKQEEINTFGVCGLFKGEVKGRL